jgi:hypothetical protein
LFGGRGALTVERSRMVVECPQRCEGGGPLTRALHHSLVSGINLVIFLLILTTRCVLLTRVKDPHVIVKRYVLVVKNSDTAEYYEIVIECER